jgi:hypothetical protein
MTQGGDLVCWTGERMKPDIHHTFRSNFNAVHVHNKLSVGPRSVCNVATASLPLKLWLYLIACAKTSSYVMYMHNCKVSSDLYNHADLKLDLEQELLQCDFDAGAVSEEAGVLTLCSCDGVASGAMHIQGKHRKSILCDFHKTKRFCGCGRTVCGTPGNEACYPWHMISFKGMKKKGLCSGRMARRHMSEHLLILKYLGSVMSVCCLFNPCEYVTYRIEVMCRVCPAHACAATT